MLRAATSITVLLLAMAVTAGCSGSERLQLATPEEAYERGKELYDRGRYSAAVEYFQRVFDFGRAHAWAPDAQYYLAHSYFNTRQYLLAANAFTRFVEFYRADPRAEEGEYLRALSYVRLSPHYQLDQTDTRNALTYLHLYLSRYPDGQYADEVIEYVDELRYKLARKQFEIAEMYERRSQFQAAAIEFLRLLDTHPDSEFADAALFGALRSYKSFAERSIPQRRPERYRLAAEQYERLVQLFPQSPLIAEAELLYREIQSELAAYDTAAAR